MTAAKRQLHSLLLLAILACFGCNCIAKDIYTDVTCVGTGAGTEGSPYCVLNQAFSDAVLSTGDVTINIFGSWLSTPLPTMNAPKFSSLTIQGWRGASPSITCYASIVPPLLQISNFAGTITIKDLTVTSCYSPIVFYNVKSVILSDYLVVDSGQTEVLNPIGPFDADLQILNSEFIANTNRFSSGGGLRTQNLTSIFINNTNFLSNKAPLGAGGGAYLESVQLVVSNCNFLANSATFTGGGGVYIKNLPARPGTPAVTKTVRRSSFVGNRQGTLFSNYGGGLFWLIAGNEGANFTINVERCSFRQNVGSNGGAGLAIDAAGAVSPFVVMVQYCAFAANSFDLGNDAVGGAMWIRGPTTNSLGVNAKLLLQTLRIVDNLAPDAPAIWATKMYMEFREMIVSGNIITNGGLYLTRAAVKLVSPATTSAVYGLQLTNSYNNMFPVKSLGSYALYIIGTSSSVFNIIDSDISYNFVFNFATAGAIRIDKQTVGIYRTTIWGNFWGAAIVADGAYIMANDSVSFVSYNVLTFLLFPISCTNFGRVIVTGNTEACLCLTLDVCGVCNGDGKSCLCPGNTVPSFINCTAPLVLQLPGTMCATYLPGTGTAHAALLPGNIPSGVSASAAGLTVRYLSLRDVVPNTLYNFTQMSPGRPIKSVTLDVNNIYQIDFRYVPFNNSGITVTQGIYQDSSIAQAGEVIFPVQPDTLKMSLDVTGWSATAADSLELEIEVEVGDAITSLELNATRSILTTTTSSYTSYIRTKNSIARFSLVDFAIATYANGTEVQVPVSFRYGTVRNNSLQIFVAFAGPFVRVFYDPDFGVIADLDGSSSSGGDGGGGDGDDTLLIEILVPVLVGSAVILVVVGILAGLAVTAYKIGMMRRARAASNPGMVSLG